MLQSITKCELCGGLRERLVRTTQMIGKRSFPKTAVEMCSCMAADIVRVKHSILRQMDNYDDVPSMQTDSNCIAFGNLPTFLSHVLGGMVKKYRASGGSLMDVKVLGSSEIMFEYFLTNVQDEDRRSITDLTTTDLKLLVLILNGSVPNKAWADTTLQVIKDRQNRGVSTWVYTGESREPSPLVKEWESPEIRNITKDWKRYEFAPNGAKETKLVDQATNFSAVT